MLPDNCESYLNERVITMAGLFAKAATKAQDSVKETKRKGVAWKVGDRDSETIGKAIHELTILEAQAKAISAKQDVIKSAVKRYCDDMFIRDYTARGSMPDTPMTLQNTDGEKLTYVCQDRGGQYGIKNDQKEALTDLLGEDAVTDLLFDETTFGFKREVLMIPGVLGAIEKALEEALTGLIESDVLDGDQAASLLDVKTKTAFRPGTLDRLTSICGRDVSRVRQFLDIAGSSFTRYIKC